MITKFSGNKKGFTLIETLVAISILLIAVVGPISLIGDALHKLYFAKDEMVAINLAQEGIEAVRQVRDSNMLDGTVAWDLGLTPGDYIVTVTPVSSVVLGVYGGVAQPVYLNGGFYEQSTPATVTQFKRLITIESVVAGREIKVTSKLTWNTGNTPGTVTVVENLFYWTKL